MHSKLMTGRVKKSTCQLLNFVGGKARKDAPDLMLDAHSLRLNISAYKL